MRLATALSALMLATPVIGAVPTQMSVELIASTLAPRPGSTVVVGFRMVPKPDWHGYWSNAGGSGISPSVTWSAPAGVEFGSLLHPAPSLFKSLGVVSYVHSGEHLLVLTMKVPAGIAAGTVIPLQAHLDFAVCSDRLCVPGNGSFSFKMMAGLGAPTADAAALNRAVARVPSSVAGGRYWSAGGKLTLALPERIRLRASSARFFPDKNGFFDAFRAEAVNGRPIRIIAPITGGLPRRITGVVTDGASSYRLSLVRGAPATENEATPAIAAPEPPVSARDDLVAAVPFQPKASHQQGDGARSQSRWSTPMLAAALAAFAVALLLVFLGRWRTP
jgi:DsbC/DsbD-like thiol-disulfide interchange protein